MDDPGSCEAQLRRQLVDPLGVTERRYFGFRSDGPDPEVPNHWLARSHADSPDIDGVVRVKGKGLKAGDLVRVKITAADGYDLTARAIGPGR